ncbi:hypothetical protein [Paenibacillus wenxiniae]|uniref:EamA-like transporter family protein n=1 Tax=Paenibacillus wenxiniae TaxID=1636843 RepID=A0ABW4RJ23_9BACL
MQLVVKESYFRHGVTIFLCIMCQALSILFSKIASTTTHDIFSLIFNGFYILSISMLVIQAFFWQKVLQNHSISDVYPLMTLVNIVLLILDCIFFNNTIKINEVLGSLIIILGIVIIGFPVKKTI